VKPLLATDVSPRQSVHDAKQSTINVRSKQKVGVVSGDQHGPLS
jgi:hypothetical protein